MPELYCPLSHGLYHCRVMKCLRVIRSSHYLIYIPIKVDSNCNSNIYPIPDCILSFNLSRPVNITGTRGNNLLISLLFWCTAGPVPSDLQTKKMMIHRQMKRSIVSLLRMTLLRHLKKRTVLSIEVTFSSVQYGRMSCIIAEQRRDGETRRVSGRCYLECRSEINVDAYGEFRSRLASVTNSRGLITHRSHIFVDRYILPPSSTICFDARRSLLTENAGGKSEISEMYSIDYFTKIYHANKTILEKEVSYWIDYKMVDFICTINSCRVGVSVARAMGYPNSINFTDEMAASLLYKKLYGLIVARNAVNKSHSFFKSILHIWCQDNRIAMLLRNAFSKLDDNDYGLDVKGILLLQLTVCGDPQLYKNFLRN